MAFQVAAVGWLWVGLKAMLMGLVAWVVSNLGAIIASAMVSLGLYFFVAEPATNLIGEQIQGAFGGLSGTVLETLYYLNVDDYLAMVSSAWVVKATYEAGKKVSIGKKKPAVGAA